MERLSGALCMLGRMVQLQYQGISLEPKLEKERMGEMSVSSSSARADGERRKYWDVEWVAANAEAREIWEER